MNNSSDRTTLILSAGRSYARLAMVIKRLNESLYDLESFEEDRIEFNPIMSDKGDLLHYEIKGNPLDFFAIGLRYGASEENEYLTPYLRDFYRDMVSKPLETSAL